jgi:putative redox protein
MAKVSSRDGTFLSIRSVQRMSDNIKEVVADWKGDMSFIGRNLTGGSVQIGTLDGQPGVGPMELLLLGVAGCTGMDIVSILQKKNLNLSQFQVKVCGKRAETYPMVFTEIDVTYLLWGESLPFKAVEQAIELSEEKYCSASAMLRATASLKSSFRIYAPGDPAEN